VSHWRFSQLVDGVEDLAEAVWLVAGQLAEEVNDLLPDWWRETLDRVLVSL